MKISILGLGYVGSVSAACLAQNGHFVIGVDRDSTKVSMINEGFAPVIEESLPTIIERTVRENRLRATTDASEAIRQSEITLVCVGTPDNSNGSIDMSHIERVCQEIGTALADKSDYHLVVVRSTVLPGTMETLVIPTLEAYSHKKSGRDFGVAFNPEFLRETTAVKDFYNPPKTVIGAHSAPEADLIARLYEDIDAPLFKTPVRVAEMVKYCDNAFHALKVVFGNEIGLICKALGIDSHEVMHIFCQDHQLNLSAAYLKPGFAFGGSCLPKDIKALTYMAKHKDLDLPLLNALMPSNQAMIQYALERIISCDRKRIGFLGLAFKAGTDDLRNSPIIALIEQLLGKGYDIRIYDHHVNLGRLRGANRQFIEERIPHISRLMEDQVDKVIAHAQVVVIGNRDQAFSQIFDRLSPKQYVLDLVRIQEKIETTATYEGISW
ncbi:MAG: nucleotide sugar dehydrogenase [Desulfobacteraceae bacterium]|nr:MAG: nucleotide sugar dehydrogenase [Desulfobacteraceae bacterium]